MPAAAAAFCSTCSTAMPPQPGSSAWLPARPQRLGAHLEVHLPCPQEESVGPQLRNPAPPAPQKQERGLLSARAGCVALTCWLPRSHHHPPAPLPKPDPSGAPATCSDPSGAPAACLCDMMMGMRVRMAMGDTPLCSKPVSSSASPPARRRGQRQSQNLAWDSSGPPCCQKQPTACRRPGGTPPDAASGASRMLYHFLATRPPLSL